MSALESCLARARRRSAALLVMKHGAASLAVGAACAILLLVTGTQLLNWYWPVAVFIIAAGTGLYRAWRAMPSAYVLAQRIDRQLALRDTLSTAHYFQTRSGRIAEAQREDAERLASAAVLAQALPFRMEREFYLASALVLIGAGLFGVRYGLLHRLDLSPPLVSLKFDYGQPESNVGPRKTAANRMQNQTPQEQAALSLEPETEVDLGPPPESALDTVDVPDMVNDPLPDKSAQTDQKLEGVSLEAEGKENGKQSKDGESGEQPSEAGSPLAASEDGKSQNQQKGGESRQNQNAGENSSLMDKMRDAMANLMSRLKMQPQQGGSQQQMASSKNGQNASQSRERTDQRGAPQPGQQQAGDASDADERGRQEGEGGEQSQNGDSKQMANGADQQRSNDPKSGMGKQDGAKDVQLAEQLEAMGKLSEIFGKRAANVSGEVMVEVASGKQQIRTPYSQRSGQHTAAGGEIHRDEVPLIYQPYIQKYFQEIRKAAPASAPKPVQTP
jgi:hypothetical protein